MTKGAIFVGFATVISKLPQANSSLCSRIQGEIYESSKTPQQVNQFIYLYIMAHAKVVVRPKESPPPRPPPLSPASAFINRQSTRFDLSLLFTRDIECDREAHSAALPCSTQFRSLDFEYK